MATEAISSAAPVAVTLTSPDGQSSLVAAVVLADPLNGPASAQAQLPASVDVTLNVVPVDTLPTITGPEVFKITAVSVGSATIDLSDGYTLSIDEYDSAVFVANAAQGERLRIWGACDIELAGADKARFWGTTSVVLGNGAKITIETAQEAPLSDIFRLDRLTVTQEDRALVIKGVSLQALGDMTIEQSRDGYDIDDETRDGLTLIEGDAGWSDEYDNAVTPETLAATAPGNAYGPGSTMLSLGEVCAIVGRYIVFSQIVSLSAQWSPPTQFDRPVDGGAARAARQAELDRLSSLHPVLAGRNTDFSNVTRAALI